MLALLGWLIFLAACLYAGCAAGAWIDRRLFAGMDENAWRAANTKSSALAEAVNPTREGRTNV